MRVRGHTCGNSRETALSAVARTMELRTYLENNRTATVDYGRLRRHRKAVSTSWAEGLVNDIANSRMGKNRRMRWSPQGAYRVAAVRVAFLDERLGEGHLRAA